MEGVGCLVGLCRGSVCEAGLEGVARCATRHQVFVPVGGIEVGVCGQEVCASEGNGALSFRGQGVGFRDKRLGIRVCRA